MCSSTVHAVMECLHVVLPSCGDVLLCLGVVYGFNGEVCVQHGACCDVSRPASGGEPGVGHGVLKVDMQFTMLQVSAWRWLLGQGMAYTATLPCSEGIPVAAC